MGSRKAVEVGSRVMYSAEWLRSTGQHTGPIPFARGVVTAITDLGQTKLATVDWRDEEVPSRVNVANLETY